MIMKREEYTMFSRAIAWETRNAWDACAIMFDWHHDIVWC